METAAYSSFLVRIWREQHDGAPGDCRGEIEHIQSGACWQFDTMTAVLLFLQRAADGMLGTLPDEEAGTGE